MWTSNFYADESKTSVLYRNLNRLHVFLNCKDNNKVANKLASCSSVTYMDKSPGQAFKTRRSIIIDTQRLRMLNLISVAVCSNPVDTDSGSQGNDNINCKHVV